MTVTVADWHLVKGTVFVAMTDPQPTLTYAVGDVVLLILMGDTPSSVTLDGVGVMTRVGHDGFHNIYSSGRLTSSGTTHFTYGSGSFWETAAGVLVSGSNGVPALAASSTYDVLWNFGDPSLEGQLKSIPQGAGAGNMSIAVQSAQATAWSGALKIVYLDEVNVPAIHDTIGSAFEVNTAAAIGIDMSPLTTGSSWSWTLHCSDPTHVNSADLLAVRWNLTFAEYVPPPEEGAAGFDEWWDVLSGVPSGVDPTLRVPISLPDLSDTDDAADAATSGAILGWTGTEWGPLTDLDGGTP